MAECYVRTLYPYINRQQDELSFDTGVELKIIKKHNDGWWLACDENHSLVGLIPSNYVEEIQERTSKNITDTYSYPDIVLKNKDDVEKKRGGSEVVLRNNPKDGYSNPDKVLAFESKEEPEHDNYNDPDEVLMLESKQTKSEEPYTNPDIVLLGEES